MTEQQQKAVNELQPGYCIMLETGVKAYRAIDGRVTYSVKSNRKDKMPGGKSQCTFDSFDAARQLVRYIGTKRPAQRVEELTPRPDNHGRVARRVERYDKAQSYEFDPVLDPMMDALDELHEKVVDAIAERDLSQLRELARAYSQMCESSMSFLSSESGTIGSSGGSTE